MGKKLEEMNLGELKIRVYDLSDIINTSQAELQIANTLIAKKKAEPKAE